MDLQQDQELQQAVEGLEAVGVPRDTLRSLYRKYGREVILKLAGRAGDISKARSPEGLAKYLADRFSQGGSRPQQPQPAQPAASTPQDQDQLHEVVSEQLRRLMERAPLTVREVVKDALLVGGVHGFLYLIRRLRELDEHGKG